MSALAPREVGILGGTFDPPHRGHLLLAQAACAAARLSRVLLIPAANPPHKKRADMAPACHRLAMTKLLAEADSRLGVDDREIRRGDTSYTIDTLRELAAEHPEWRLRLIMGADMAMIFHTWRAAEEVLRLAPPLVAERPGTPLPPDLVSAGPAEISVAGRRLLQSGRFFMPACDISSTRIRAALGRGEDVSAFLLSSVLAYIQRHGLYGCAV
ncbi:MAG: nicotinate (nicotinamide) nucleotide adenylyltransferase [Planctomycetota bacterium]|nr:nicotinate (nicotinamide) nucleotide adenylyltransferase [Planctomycetota bacterium]